jgi:uncharacterized protein (TIGR04255 family)
MTKKLPEFGRPPLNEVAFGLQFGPVADLHAAHIGTYWASIRDRYPETDEQVIIAHIVEKFEFALTQKPQPAEGDSVLIDGVPVFPRYWFLNKSKLQLIQVQQDRFHRNWRQIDGTEEYPRYSHLVKQFMEDWFGFVAFLRDLGLTLPVVDQCELTYINHIVHRQKWDDPLDLPKIFALWSKRPKGAFLPLPESSNLHQTYRLPDERGRLHVQTKQGFRKRDQQPVTVFDLTARGAPTGTDASAVQSWFDMAHEWIVETFTELTTPEMHKVWERTR